ncbi:MAG TPA: hypothetical protein VJ901_04715 [Thermoanaerobaculia bacterium]|nr:hypothetical protein [Thermoanaerobaculia bacterium]
MRFTIEERHLTDLAGKLTTTPAPVSFHSCDAESVEDAVRSFVSIDGAEIIGKIQTFPGFQGIATVRKPTGVYTLAIAPASQQMRLS